MIKELASVATSGCIDLLLESLTFQNLAVKQHVLKSLLNINRKEVFEGLLTLLKLGGPGLIQELKELVGELNPIPELMEKMDNWASDPGKFEMVVAALGIIGQISDESVVETVAQHLRHVDYTIKSTAIKTLQNIGSPKCLKFLFPTLKLADEPVALLILDLIGSFEAPETILPLLHVMGRSEEAVKKKILSFLTSFPPDQLETVIEGNLNNAPPGLRRNALRLFEATGRVEAARRIREQFKDDVEIKPVVKQTTDQLSCKIKTSGDMAMLSLSGILDVYTLPKLSQTLKSLFTKGNMKIFLACNHLKTVDDNALRSLNNLGGKIEPFGGLLMLISMDSVSQAKRETFLNKVEYYNTLKEAVMSFSPSKLEEAVPLSKEMLEPGTRVELLVQAGLNTSTRVVNIVSFDGKNLVLEWFLRSVGEVFKEDLNSNVKITLLNRNQVVTFESAVIQQVFLPEPYITLSRPRKGRVVDYRRQVRVAIDIPVTFYHILSNKQIRKDLSGQCRNLSIGGMLLATQEEVPENDIIVSVFTGQHLLEGQKAPGQVVNSHKTITTEGICFEYGISFLQIQDALKDRIAQIVYDEISTYFDREVPSDFHRP